MDYLNKISYMSTFRLYEKKECVHEYCYIWSAVVKINKSQYIALFVVSGSIRKLFSIDCVNVYFSQSIINYFFSIDLKLRGYPTFLISWFMNFNIVLLILNLPLFRFCFLLPLHGFVLLQIIASLKQNHVIYGMKLRL